MFSSFLDGRINVHQNSMKTSVDTITTHRMIIELEFNSNALIRYCIVTMPCDSLRTLRQRRGRTQRGYNRALECLLGSAAKAFPCYTSPGQPLFQKRSNGLYWWKWSLVLKRESGPGRDFTYCWSHDLDGFGHLSVPLDKRG